VAPWHRDHPVVPPRLGYSSPGSASNRPARHLPRHRPHEHEPVRVAAKAPCPLTKADLNVNVETTKLAEGRHTIGVGSRTRRATGSSGRHAASFRVRNARPNDRPAARTRHGRVRMWFAVNRQIHVTTRVGRRVATRLAARPPRPRDPRRLNRDLPLGPRSPAPAQDRHAQPQAWATDVDPAFESDRDARGRRRVAFYRRASLPGPATSRANHVLTTRNRRGGPQDTQPGPDGYRRDSSPPATARPARKAHDSAGRDEPARTRWRCTRGPEVGPKRRGASRVTTLMDDAAPKPAAQYSADSWRPGVPWLRKVVTFGGPHRGRARRRHPAERPRRQRAQGLRGRTRASGVPRPRHPREPSDVRRAGPPRDRACTP
jgi:hypothetical protein